MENISSTVFWGIHKMLLYLRLVQQNLDKSFCLFKSNQSTKVLQLRARFAAQTVYNYIHALYQGQEGQ